ncbi:MAG TPA: hypothetical protein VGB07_08295 [Blastocatellia bacterium]
MASQKSGTGAVTVNTTKGSGQDSKTIKLHGLTFRLRLNDRGYRVMLQPGDRYLVSLRSSEWSAVEHNKAAFVGTVKEKLRERIAKSSGGDRIKLESLLQQIEEASK